MKDMMQLGRYVVLAAAGLGLAGCGGWSFAPPMRGNPVTDPMNLPGAPTGTGGANFSQALAGEYGNFAHGLNQSGDFADADYFARKSEAAAGGQAVPPEVNGNWLIPLEVPNGYRTELANARTRLVTALDSGARDRNPALAARAQERYDCWVEGMEDNYAAASNGPCKADFLAAMDELEGRRAVPQPPAAAQPAPPAPTREYRVYFEFNRSNLLPEAQQILQRVAQDVRNDPNLRVVLVGKADRSGSDQYNLALSKRRADAVRTQLQRDGVPAGRIDERYVGEREPPVPTPDGVREPRNRVVEISLR
jgi:OOP family OmpA-OmpF porin